jgi:O-antigen/teichoic acid export membrane protein
MSASRTESRSAARHGARGVLRGSSLLLIGRVIAIAVNLLVQVLTVRYLAKSDYGAFAWALAIASMGASTVLLGLNRGVARFAPIHHERREYGELFGTLAFCLATVAGLGLAVVVFVVGTRGLFVGKEHGELSVAMLLILIGLVPLDALDALFETVLAVFAGARSIFLRRYVLAPGLKLLAVVLVVALEGNVRWLATAYLIEGLLGITVYSLVLWRVLKRQGLLAELRARRWVLPGRGFFLFSFPLLSTDLLLSLETPMVVVFLEHWHGTAPVAELRATEQIAGMCLVAFQAFKILFRSQAARLYARGDEVGLGELYWRNAAWVAVLSFPILAVCLFLAEPVTVWLCGPAYSGAGVLLAILAAGKYVNAATGMNTFTLQVYARVKLILGINVAAAVLGLCLSLGLVPRLGAIGGAIAIGLATVIRNTLYQLALIATTRAGIVPRAAMKTYGSVLAAVAILWIVRSLDDGVAVVAAAIAVVSLLLVRVNRRFLEVGDTFPELARVPFLRVLLSAGTS